MTTASIAANQWKDSKRPLWMLGLVIPLLPAVCWALVALTGSGLFWWFGPVFFYGIVPLIDHLVGEDHTVPPESVVPQLESERYYRWITYAFTPLQYAATVFAAWLAVNGNMAWWEIAGLLATIAIVNGVAINTAHELGHKKEGFERWLSKVTLAPMLLGHFFVEHNRGHHVRVATPEDPASARMGESFWEFLPRTLMGSLRSAWALEAQRLGRQDKPVLHWQNHNLQAWAITVVLFGALTVWLGWGALAFLVVQGVIAATLLENVNYLEHYGLKREKLADGRYERCQPHHSWNSNSTVTNLMLYQLQRHSDHHANPTRRYQSLRPFQEAPQLPAGYATLVPLTYFPSLWFRLMDKRVVEHYRGDLSRANLQPSKRAKLIARYHAPQAGKAA